MSILLLPSPLGNQVGIIGNIAEGIHLLIIRTAVLLQLDEFIELKHEISSSFII